jgi:hypothetical protein
LVVEEEQGVSMVAVVPLLVVEEEQGVSMEALAA